MIGRLVPSPLVGEADDISRRAPVTETRDPG
jgi:hypothetical protein